MQDRYVGDVGDFGKYGLLKALCGTDLSLGVVWYLYPDEEDNGDGGHVRYLEPTPQNRRRFRDCDPALYEALGGIVRDGERHVASARKRGVLPEDTTFYEAPLSFKNTPWAGSKTKGERVAYREAWAQGALETTRGCDVVFADPDNGFETTSVQRHHGRAPKYTFFDELEPYISRGQNLVVYHHLHRASPTKAQVYERLAQIDERLGRKSFALRYWRGSSRAFLSSRPTPIARSSLKGHSVSRKPRAGASTSRLSSRRSSLARKPLPDRCRIVIVLSPGRRIKEIVTDPAPLTPLSFPHS